jgi:hypothetical protein
MNSRTKLAYFRMDQGLVVIPLMHIINEFPDDIEEACCRPIATTKNWPISRVQIFNEVKATVAELRKKVFQGSPDMRHLMASIIQYHIYTTHFLQYGYQKIWIILGPNAHLKIRAFKVFAIWIYINAVNGGCRPKILAPHLKAATLGDTDLQKPYWLATVSGKITIIERDVMMPLMNKFAFVAGKKIDQVTTEAVFGTDIFSHALCRVEAEFVYALGKGWRSDF